MSFVINLRHLEEHNSQLKGKIPVKELDIETRDEVIRLGEPLRYELEVQKLEDGLLCQGLLSLELQCQCVRCLKPFIFRLELTNWTSHFPLRGEDSVPVVNDSVDLTPYIREDILLEFPQHPLCDPECRGLPKTTVGKEKDSGGAGKPEAGSSAWAELNKLKF